jgi:hypothetical protein
MVTVSHLLSSKFVCVASGTSPLVNFQFFSNNASVRCAIAAKAKKAQQEKISIVFLILL